MFLAKHITNQKCIYGRKFTKYLHGPQSLFNILMIFGIKEKNIILTPYNVFLAITTIIPVLLKTGFVVQGHILYYKMLKSVTQKSELSTKIF